MVEGDFERIVKRSFRDSDRAVETRGYFKLRIQGHLHLGSTWRDLKKVFNRRIMSQSESAYIDCVKIQAVWLQRCWFTAGDGDCAEIAVLSPIRYSDLERKRVRRRDRIVQSSAKRI